VSPRERGGGGERDETSAQPDTAPVGLTWRMYVERLAERAGGWTALAEELVRVIGERAELPDDLLSIEKGLRRLARRGNQPGGQYGRWLLRHLGVPEDIEKWARWLAQYHRRFADLPLTLRLEQLRLWDRPPFAESRLAAWTHVGLASVHLRRREDADARIRLERAREAAPRAGGAAIAEVALLDAYVATNDGDRARGEAYLDAAERAFTGPAAAGVEPDDRACLQARLLGQRAYHLTSPPPGATADVAGAQRLFEQITDGLELPFVAFRRDNGLAYCAWKQGDTAAGLALARRAADHAGDGGFVRFRVLALNLIARMTPDADEARTVRDRAARLARSIEDEELLAAATRGIANRRD
jgi:hypothetical protein